MQAASSATARARRKEVTDGPAPLGGDSRLGGRRSADLAAWAALAGLLAVAGVLVFHITRGTTLWFDEWQWVLHRRGNGVDDYLSPHNGHLSLVPVAIYKLLFATAGIADCAPYRALVPPPISPAWRWSSSTPTAGSAATSRCWPPRCSSSWGRRGGTSCGPSRSAT